MRNPEHIKEMLNAPTIYKYLKDTSNQVAIEVKKLNLEQDKRECVLEYLLLIKDYGLPASAGEGVFEFLENILDKTLDLNSLKCLNKMYELLGEYEPFDVKERKISQFKNKVKAVILKYSKKEQASSHHLDSVTQFWKERQGLC